MSTFHNLAHYGLKASLAACPSWACCLLLPCLHPGVLLSSSLHRCYWNHSFKVLFIQLTPCSRVCACHDSPSWRWPGLAIDSPDPSQLCSRNPLLQVATTGPPFTYHFFNLQQVPPSSWLFIKLGILSTLFAENAPSAGRHLTPTSAHLNVIPFPLFTPFLVSQEFTVFEDTPLSFICGFCVSLYPQLDCKELLCRVQHWDWESTSAGRTVVG